MISEIYLFEQRNDFWAVCLFKATGTFRSFPKFSAYATLIVVERNINRRRRVLLGATNAHDIVQCRL